MWGSHKLMCLDTNFGAPIDWRDFEAAENSLSGNSTLPDDVNCSLCAGTETEHLRGTAP